MLRNCFVREEGETLILCAGIPARWLEQPAPIRFGPAPTAFGSVSLSIIPDPGAAPRVEWQGDWHREAPPIEVRLPGFAPMRPPRGSGSVVPGLRGEAA
jgi:hypothetical protein